MDQYMWNAQQCVRILESKMEGKLGALFMNFHRGAALRIALEEMGHRQPPTPVLTDSATIDGFVNDNIRKGKSIEIDMRFYCICDRVRQGHYLVYWEKRNEKLVD